MIHEAKVIAAGSRRGRKKQRTRREILDAVRRLGLRARIDSLTVEAISEAADVARATFFLHFPSKSALLVCMESELAERFAEALDSHPGRSAERLQKGLGELFAWGAIAGDLLQTSLADRGEAPGPLLEVMEGFARSGQRRGDLRRDLPPESVARVIAGALAGMLADGRAGNAEAGGARCEELLGILLNGLREPKPRLKWSARG